MFTGYHPHWLAKFLRQPQPKVHYEIIRPDAEKPIYFDTWFDDIIEARKKREEFLGKEAPTNGEAR